MEHAQPGELNTDLRILEPLLDLLPCGFASFADDGQLRAINTTLLDQLGYTSDELAGRHVDTLLTVGSRIFYQTHFFPLLRLHGRADEIFLLLRAKNGDDVAMLVNAVRRERNGEWLTDVVLLRLQERRKFEDALLLARRSAEEANQAKSAFLAMMSHELRTPLNAIGGYAQLLELGVHGPITKEQNEALGRIVRSQQHLLRLINDLLNLARIESGRVEYAMDDVVVRDVVQAILPMIEPQLHARNLTLDVSVPAELHAYADREKVEQILLNLLSNANKFTSPGGRIGVHARVSPNDSERVRIDVSDTGVGIPKDRIEQVFQAFVQLGNRGNRPGEGTGLGLAISREMARGMGGGLFAASEVGVGSVFTLELPVAARR